MHQVLVCSGLATKLAEEAEAIKAGITEKDYDAIVRPEKMIGPD
jgi:hypothetical protein